MLGMLSVQDIAIPGTVLSGKEDMLLFYKVLNMLQYMVGNSE
jgi:hypothetical protein